jgi:transcriptional regulator with XRE-family HTH domain
MMAKKEAGLTFGRKLRKLREAEGLSVEELAGQVGRKPGYLDRLEQDEVLPSVAEILTLARRLSVEPSTFMGKGGSRRAAEQRRAALQTRTRDYAYRLLTPAAEDRRLMAFQVTIDPESEHRKVGYQHEGEEFIYVLSGRLRITVDRKTTALGPGQCLLFDSGRKHHLQNPGREATRLLVVLDSP